MLFSATQTRKIEDLARVSLKKEPLYVGVDDQKDKATVEGLEQVCYEPHRCKKSRALDKREFLMIIFLISHHCLIPYVVTRHLNRLIETVHMRGHNIWSH